MLTNLPIRTSKSNHRKSGVFGRSAVAKRRVSLVPASAANNVPSLSLMEQLFGDEFPDAFSDCGARSHEGSKCLLDLPVELLTIICDSLSKLDIKRLRLTSKKLALDVQLSIDRVYISPNQANLNCLQGILQHPTYRIWVREIVWDDAQLEEYPTIHEFRHALNIDSRKTIRDVERRLDVAMEEYLDDGPEYRPLDDDDFFSDDGRLTAIAKGILLQTNDRLSRDAIAQDAAVMSVEESYTLYQTLYQEEQDLIKCQADIKALYRALADFPKLHKITLTSEVWRPWNLYPEYHSPFYRSLPPGFRKPSVWPWLGLRPQPTPAQNAYRYSAYNRFTREVLSDWRGYNIILSALLTLCPGKIDEFIVDAGNEPTGIDDRFFHSTCPGIPPTVRVLQLVPLKRLHLALHPPFHFLTGIVYEFLLLEHAFSRMRHLEHLDLNINFLAREKNCMLYFCDVSNMIGTTLAKRLKTFKLRNVAMLRDEVIELVTAMHQAESVIFDNVRQRVSPPTALGSESWHPLFHTLKERYSDPTWRAAKPQFTWIKPVSDLAGEAYHCRLVDEEINAYLYADRPSPFHHDTDEPTAGTGWIIDDRDKSFRVKPSAVSADVRTS